MTISGSSPPTRSGRLAVIDTAANKVAGWVDLPAFGYGTAPTIDGKYLVVAVTNANKVSVVDLQTRKVVKNIDVPRAAAEKFSCVRMAKMNGYVSCNASGKIAAIRISDWTVDTLIDAGKDADGLAWSLFALKRSARVGISPSRPCKRMQVGTRTGGLRRRCLRVAVCQANPHRSTRAPASPAFRAALEPSLRARGYRAPA